MLKRPDRSAFFARAGGVFLLLLPFFACDSAQPVRTLDILFTGHSHGTLLGCDCPSGINGGLPRRLTLVNRYREENGRVLLVDIGDLLSTYPQAPRDRLVLEASGKLAYDALNIGALEFINGIPFFLKYSPKLPFVSANLDIDSLTPVSYKKVRYVNAGDLTIGITGVVDTAAFDLVPWSGLTITPPQQALARLVPDIRKLADLVVVLSRQAPGADSLLAVRVPGIDIIIGSFTDTLRSRPVRAGNTIIARAGESGDYLGRLSIGLNRKDRVVISRGEMITLDISVAEDPELKQFIWEKQARKQ